MPTRQRKLDRPPARIREARIRALTAGVVLWGLGPWLSIVAGSTAWAQAPSATTASEVSRAARLSATIEASGDVADIGVPFRLSSDASGGRPPYLYEWRDSTDHLHSGPVYTERFSLPGPYSTTLYVLDASGATIHVTRDFRVAPRPQIFLNASARPVDVGAAFAVDPMLVGGAPPYRLSWTVEPNGTSGVVGNISDDAPVLTVSAQTSGPVWLGLDAEDAWNLSTSVTAEVAVASPALALSLPLDVTPAEVGAPVLLSASIVGGSLPVVWSSSVVGASDENNGSQASGTATEDSIASWTWQPTELGDAEVRWSAADAAGGEAEAAGQLDVHPALSALLGFGPPSASSNGSVEFLLFCEGGWSPYAYALRAFPGGWLNGTSNTTTPVPWTVVPDGPGWINVTVEVRDALNSTATSNLTFFAGSTSPPPTPSAPSAGVGETVDSTTENIGFITLGLAAVAGAIQWVRKRSRRLAAEGFPPIDTTATIPWIPEVLEGADVLERDALGLLAEERGFSLAQVDAALDHWEKAGRLRTGMGPDGRETVQWVDRHEASGSTDTASPGGE